MGKWRLPLAEVPDVSAAEPVCDSAPSDHSARPQALEPYPRAFRDSDGHALGRLLFGKKGIDGLHWFTFKFSYFFSQKDDSSYLVAFFMILS